MSSTNGEQDTTSIPAQAIIVLCLVGAGAAILMGWAIFRHFREDGDDDVARERGDLTDNEGYTQAQYMRIVRLRNQEDLRVKYDHHNYMSQQKPIMHHQVYSSVSSL